MKDRKVLKIGSSFMITLPMDIVRGFGWSESTQIIVKITGKKTIEITEAQDSER
ncbi:MAG: AbrB/MazE/SpoVT family DNA-binding domain-containing protein [Methanocellales archaeon]|nr:AbrB/MazE/SpoVT family DNA-binding domain-containing protein [Methanocellales archaeon]MDD3421547.1 AbrB/MazE/SpoVT family DNA-binding domain-containing protein [Methanocellales archaeon]MDD4898062.1 AbrB/MazE/SpoVT family DNA-binding domain-containing protein [Methanocellales archaeon]MDD5447457.1 AbrB/MazE/SpoVT family DNA-binding domain-containing protein [Methanocellales archaeon]